jgi:hypothetical protein
MPTVRSVAQSARSSQTEGAAEVVVARNQILKFHGFGFRHHTAVAEPGVVRQKFLHALLYGRFGHVRVMIQQLYQVVRFCTSRS